VYFGFKQWTDHNLRSFPSAYRLIIALKVDPKLAHVLVGLCWSFLHEIPAYSARKHAFKQHEGGQAVSRFGFFIAACSRIKFFTVHFARSCVDQSHGTAHGHTPTVYDKHVVSVARAGRRLVSSVRISTFSFCGACEAKYFN